MDTTKSIKISFATKNVWWNSSYNETPFDYSGNDVRTWIDTNYFTNAKQRNNWNWKRLDDDYNYQIVLNVSKTDLPFYRKCNYVKVDGFELLDSTDIDKSYWFVKKFTSQKLVKSDGTYNYKIYMDISLDFLVSLNEQVRSIHGNFITTRRHFDRYLSDPKETPEMLMCDNYCVKFHEPNVIDDKIFCSNNIDYTENSTVKKNDKTGVVEKIEKINGIEDIYKDIPLKLLDYNIKNINGTDEIILNDDKVISHWIVICGQLTSADKTANNYISYSKIESIERDKNVSSDVSLPYELIFIPVFYSKAGGFYTEINIDKNVTTITKSREILNQTILIIDGFIMKISKISAIPHCNNMNLQPVNLGDYYDNYKGKSDILGTGKGNPIVYTCSDRQVNSHSETNKPTINLYNSTYKFLNDSESDFINGNFLDNITYNKKNDNVSFYEPHLNVAKHQKINISDLQSKSNILDLEYFLKNNISYSLSDYNKIVNFNLDNFNVKYIFKNNKLNKNYSYFNEELLISNNTNYILPWGGDSYLEWMKQHYNQRQASLDNINIQKDVSVKNAENSFAGNMVSATLGSLWNSDLGGSIAGMVSTTIQRDNAIRSAKAEAEMKLNTLNGYYNDATHKPSNVNTQGDSDYFKYFNKLNFQTDENVYNRIWNNENYMMNSLFMFKIKQPDYILNSIAFNKNKYGYDTKRWESWNFKNLSKDVCPRKYWNQIKINDITNDNTYLRTIFDDEMLQTFSTIFSNGCNFVNIAYVGNILDYNKENLEIGYNEEPIINNDVINLIPLSLNTKSIFSLNDYVSNTFDIFNWKDVKVNNMVRKFLNDNLYYKNPTVLISHDYIINVPKIKLPNTIGEYKIDIKLENKKNGYKNYYELKLNINATRLVKTIDNSDVSIDIPFYKGIKIDKNGDQGDQMVIGYRYGKAGGSERKVGLNIMEPLPNDYYQNSVIAGQQKKDNTITLSTGGEVKLPNFKKTVEEIEFNIDFNIPTNFGFSIACDTKNWTYPNLYSKAPHFRYQYLFVNGNDKKQLQINKTIKKSKQIKLNEGNGWKINDYLLENDIRFFDNKQNNTNFINTGKYIDWKNLVNNNFKPNSGKKSDLIWNFHIKKECIKLNFNYNKINNTIQYEIIIDFKLMQLTFEGDKIKWCDADAVPVYDLTYSDLYLNETCFSWSVLNGGNNNYIFNKDKTTHNYYLKAGIKFVN